ncbi:PhoH family protein [Fundidesulfovibrio soli]|uniref:PhoH family protein n=1 Tax=Fundidesulfovibrio soli TaxID=2922716 RepID=UPI001FAF487A|nr:PhoH family protein [Fundidesulfovibrio soli]
MSKPNTAERRLEFDDSGLARELFGPHNAHLDLVRELTGVRADSRGNALTLRGGSAEALDRVAEVMVELYGALRKGAGISPESIKPLLLGLEGAVQPTSRRYFEQDIFVVSPKKSITPRTLTQREYLGTIRATDMVFGVGPAGTGKTYLAVAVAVAELLARRVKRIVLTRPAVEAGEKLGFLPGDMMEKVNPYLRPLYDALHDMLDFQRVSEMIEEGVIEIAPLAFMRGRTLNDACIILDEAQNTTPEQMKMFLTRMGFGSKAIVTGDVTQVDLPRGAPSGLVDAVSVLEGVEGIGIVYFSEEDVIRHPLVGRIVKAYERHTQPST